ncbi:MAG: zinc-ribbon domain-containing protein, partial [Planctomycetota bacterium]
MLIQCTSCGTQAKLPDSKEGAKVKCPSCGHVYVARPVRSRSGGASSGRASASAGRRSSGARSSGGSSSGVAIGVGVGAAALLGVFALRAMGGDDPAEAREPAAKPAAETADKTPSEPWVDPESYDGPAMKFARSLHDAANAGNETRLSDENDESRAYAAPAEESEGELPPWSELDPAARARALDDIVAPLMERGEDAFVANWTPYDGRYGSGDGDVHVLRLKSSPAGGGAAVDRWTEWTVVEVAKGDWRWIDADRAKTSAENAAERRAKAPKKVTLSDGIEVREAEARVVEYDRDVPAAKRREIDGAIETFFADDGSRKKWSAARKTILDAGPASVAPLLTRLEKEARLDLSVPTRQRTILNVGKLLEEITD